MKKILVVVLTHPEYYPLFPQVWNAVQNLEIPEGYSLEFLAVADTNNELPNFLNNYNIQKISVDTKDFIPKDPNFKSPVTEWNEKTIFRVAKVRNEYLKIVREGNYDWLLNIDGDAIPPKDALVKLLSTGKKAIGGWAYNKKKGGVPIVPNKVKYGRIFEVKVIGKWCFLEHKDIFNNVDYKLFTDRKNTNEDERRHFDIRKYGEKIYCHPDVFCEHLVDTDTLYKPQNWDNVGKIGEYAKI